MTESHELEGIDRAPTEAWLAEHVSGVSGPFEWSRLTGGTSNLTYGVRDAQGRRFVVRRPPTGKLLPKAHDMGREYKILCGLAPTAVPVAQPYAYCTDVSVTGAPFYVMDFCEGRTIRTTGLEIDESMPMAGRACAGDSIIDALVALHALDPGEIGLGDLGRPDAYVARQLDRWKRSWEQSHEAAQIDCPIDTLHAALSERIPAQGRGRVVHGDIGPHNMLISEAGRVVALTDWEISTLGDPLADLAYFTNAWSAEQVATDTPYGEGRLAEGYATRGELIERYAKASGRDLSELPFYVAFNHYKTLCIIQGVYGRFRAGVRGTQGLDLAQLRSRVEASARSAHSAIDAL